jgi:hypothetical protein
MIPQGYATTISLLLIAAFRAALVGSIGLCYTQYFWATLRKRVLKVRLSRATASTLQTNRTQIKLIEDLFQIQNNAFHLAGSGIYLTTPVLAAVALFCWIMPIATVYPPGALTVELYVLPINTTYNVSVFHANDYRHDTNPEALSEIRCNYDNFSNDDTIGPVSSYFEDQPEYSISSFLRTCVSRWQVYYSFQIPRYQQYESSMLTHVVAGKSQMTLASSHARVSCRALWPAYHSLAG